MAGRPIEIELADVWGEDLGVSLFVEFLSDEILQRAADECALGFPENQPLADHFIDVKQP